MWAIHKSVINSRTDNILQVEIWRLGHFKLLWREYKLFFLFRRTLLLLVIQGLLLRFAVAAKASRGFNLIAKLFGALLSTKLSSAQWRLLLTGDAFLVVDVVVVIVFSNCSKCVFTFLTLRVYRDGSVSESLIRFFFIGNIVFWRLICEMGAIVWVNACFPATRSVGLHHSSLKLVRRVGMSLAI